MPAPRKYPDELRERAVRLVFERHAARGMRLVMPADRGGLVMRASAGPGSAYHRPSRNAKRLSGAR
jgi:hypothetical protein